MFIKRSLIIALTALGYASADGVTSSAAQGVSYVVPNTATPLRASPPGFFESKGAKVGNTVAGGKYKIVEEKLVPSIFGTQKWIKIIEEKPTASPGWAYSGTSGEMQNFKMLK